MEHQDQEHDIIHSAARLLLPFLLLFIDMEIITHNWLPLTEEDMVERYKIDLSRCYSRTCKSWKSKNHTC